MFKRGKSYFIVALVLALLFSGLIQKEMINKIRPELMQENAQSKMFQSAEELVRTRYDYTENNHNCICTTLKFASIGNTVGRQMKPVWDEVKNTVEDKITGFLVRAMNPVNQELL